mmetsp:Transcript_25270/g.64206  ORF Transcript_25270/g.64206 Transcript_25270/m.64206 type:complete len:173 (-) Transcript_25270:296-814(-)
MFQGFFYAAARAARPCPSPPPSSPRTSLPVLVRGGRGDAHPRPPRALPRPEAITNTCIQACVGPALRNIQGSFEHFLDDLGNDRTRWTRNVYFYHTGGRVNTCIFYPYLCTVLRSQRFGARIYVDAVKRLLESPDWKYELFGPGQGAEYRTASGELGLSPRAGRHGMFMRRL